MLTMETRLEDLHRDMIELRNLYSSPTSSLNLVLDGLLKKVKDLEAGDLAMTYAKGRSPRKMGSIASQGPTAVQTGQPTTLASPSESRNIKQEGISYRQWTSGRVGNPSDKGSALKSGGLMQMNTNRGSLN